MDDQTGGNLKIADPEGADLEGADLGMVLRAARRRADLSQRELASRSGVAQPSIARIESGALSNPTFRTVERLLRATGVTMSLMPPAVEQAAGADAAGADAAGADVRGEWRDRAGRHYPAHLDVAVSRLEAWRRLGWEITATRERWSSEEMPEVTFDRLRLVRDERRIRQVRGAAAAIVGPARGSDGDGSGWGRVWTAQLDDGTVVGKLWARDFDDMVDGRAVNPFVTVPTGTVVLDGVIVTEDWRRLGIGRRLVGALRSAGTGAVVTLVTGNDLALFLASCGFEPTRSLLPPRWLVSRAV